MIPIPGANAALSALVASGLTAAEFHFSGSCRRRRARGEARLRAMAETEAAERRARSSSMKRPTASCTRSAIWKRYWGGELRIVVARELTKIHEEFLRGTVAEVRRELAGRDRIRGEIALLVKAQPRTRQQRHVGGARGKPSPGA